MTAAALRPDTIAALTATHGELHVFPASLQQQRFWLLDQIDGEAAAYTIPLALRLVGPLDAAALAGALQAVVDRHEALRTVFALEGGDVAQVVLPRLAIELPVEDLSALPYDERERAVAARASTNANAPFELAAGPLVRASLLRLAASEHVLLIVLHHIVADGWSTGILLSELDAAYTAHRTGEEPALPPLPLQYADYALWQRRVAGGAAAARQLDHWADRLTGVPPLELPTDRARPAVQSVAGGKREARLSPQDAELVRARARASGTTPFVVCLSAFAALLHRYSGQSDFAVGSITSGRRRSELEPIVGVFVNTLALRVTTEASEPFAALVARVRDVTIDAMANQDVPFEQVVERVQPTRDRSRSPIFQVAFQLLDGLAEEPRLADLAVSRVSATKDTAKFELTLVVRSAPDGGLVTVAEYSTALFDEETVDRMLAHYGTLLVAAARDATVPLGRLPMLGEAERALVTERWNDTAEPLPTWTVASRVLEQAASTRDVIAVRTEEEALTYRELARRSALVARRLGALGVRAGDRVAVCVDRTTTLPVALLGVLRAGAAYVPIDAAYPAERIAQVLEDARVAAILVDDPSRGSLPPTDAPIERLDAATWRADVSDAERDALPAADGGALAYVLFTSGSTGRPKGVMIPHTALANFLESMLEAPGLAAGDAIVAVTTVSFDIAGLELWLPLVTGAEVVLASRATAVDGHALRALLDRTARAVAPHRTMLQATPATWRLLLEAGWAGAPNVVMLCGGEAWPAGLAAALRARGAELWNVYGPTETTIWSTRARVTDADVPLGEPLANTTLFVLEPSGEPAPLGVPGELWIGGAGLARGYLGRDDLTAERFVEHARFGRLYRTGDLVRRMADGRVRYLGRLDNQVKVRGFRIELGEIESILAAQAEVSRAVATVIPPSAGTEARLAAYVVLDLAVGATESVEYAQERVLGALRARLRRALPDYMVPSSIMALPALPLTPNGKVDRRALPLPGVEAVTRSYVAPESALEKAIASAWGAVLGVERVGRDDDFFALGGSSLAAMRVVARLAEALPVRLTIGALFGARTVAALASLVEQRTAAPTVAVTPRITPRTDDGPAPLTAAQELVWLHEQIMPGSGAYHVTMARRLRGPLDVTALAHALDRVAACHDALRTRIVEIDGAPRQSADALAPRLDVRDLRAEPGEWRAAETARLLEQSASEPFDLAVGPPLRARLIRLADAEAVVVVVAHHVVFDGGSVALFWRDLAASYRAAVDGDGTPIERPPVQLADVATWERTAVDERATAAAVEHWRRYLGDAPATVDLPLDRPRGAGASGPAATVVRAMGAALASAVQSFAAAHQTTPFTVWLAAFQALLHRASRQDDLVVGSPFMARRHAETQGVIGHLANMLVLRTRIDRETSFDALVAQVREGSVGAFEHQEVPFERIARAVRGGDLGLPGFNVAFVIQEGQRADLSLGGVTIEPYAVHGMTAKFDLTLSLHADAAGARATLEYRADLFDAATADTLLSRYERLLSALLRAPAAPVSRATLLSAEERSLILGEWRGRAVPYPCDATIHEMVAEHARRSPGAVAIVDGDRTLTYADLDARANQLANRLRALGVRRDVTVGLCVTRSAQMVVAALAILKAGGAYVPLDPSNPSPRLAMTLVDARPRVVITERSTLPSIPLDAIEDGGRPDVLLLDADASDIGREPATPPAPDADASSLAYVIYTSGSTGTPKGVAAVHRGVVRLVANPTYVRLGPEETLLSFAPLTFDASTLELWGALCTGGRLVIFPGHTPSLEDLGDVIAAQGVTTLWLTAALFHQFVDGHLEGLRPLRQLLAGGDVLSVPHVRRVLESVPGCTLINGYGPTENTTFTCCHPMRDAATLGATVPIGRPIGNTTVYILDEWMEPVPWGVPGRLYTGGDGLARGYLGRPDLTAERFIPDPFATTLTSMPPADATDAPGARMYDTGDLARWRADGTIEFLGRADSQLKIRGFRIEPGEVEAALLAEPDVKEAVVVGRADERGAKRLVAYVVPKPGARVEGTALRLRLAERLPDYLVPSLVVSLDVLPLTESGKVDRRALPDPGAASVVEEVPPRDDVERVVARTWGDALGHAPRSVTAGFFDLGGDSLLAIRIVAQLHKVFRVRLSLRRFFDEPTIAGVARAIAAAEAKPGQVAAIAALLMRIQNMTPEQRERLRRENARPDQPTQ